MALVRLALLAAPWVAAGPARAVDVPPAPAAASSAPRPLDLSPPRDVRARPAAASAPGDGRSGDMPYGSGYESRRQGGASDAAANTRPATAGRHGSGRRGGR